MINLKQYRDPWLAQGFDTFIGFYPREFYMLENFSSFQVAYHGHTFPTVEHAYQSLSFEGVAEIARLIASAPSAHEAKEIAQRHKSQRRPDWDTIKVEVMEELLRQKLRQHPYCRQKLLETGDYLLVEDSPKDSFWGIGADRDGQNQLGKLWMKLRQELRAEQSKQADLIDHLD